MGALLQILLSNLPAIIQAIQAIQHHAPAMPGPAKKAIIMDAVKLSGIPEESQAAVSQFVDNTVASLKANNSMTSPVTTNSPAGTPVVPPS